MNKSHYINWFYQDKLDLNSHLNTMIINNFCLLIKTHIIFCICHYKKNSIVI